MRLLFLILVVGQMAWAEKAETFKVDSSHASVVFKISHFGFSNVYGSFSGVEGTMIVDEDKPEKSSFDMKLKADTVDTRVAKRDDHLKSPDFFNVKQFPEIALKSKSVKKNGANKYDIVADLTIHGVTKPVKFVWTNIKVGKDPWNNIRMGGETAFKIKRSDFNMTFMSKPNEVGDEVDLMISLEAVKQ